MNKKKLLNAFEGIFEELVYKSTIVRHERKGGLHEAIIK
jgi:hypothetical protein